MRNPYISFLQAFGILLVVGHAFPTDGHGAAPYRWIYRFHMPLWVFLCGYLLRYTAPEAVFLFSWFPQSALRVLLYDGAQLDPRIRVPLSTAAGVMLP